MRADVLKRNAVRVVGQGPPLVLVHGFGCDQAMWNNAIPELSGFRLIQYDLTGMGASDYGAYNRARHGTLHGHADDLIEVVEAVDEGPVVAVGHSVSAAIVALAANKRPDLFRALAMICPNPYYMSDANYEGGFDQAGLEGLLQSMQDNYLGWSGQLSKLVGGDDETSETLNERFCRNDPEITHHFAGVTFLGDHRADMEAVRHPTLIINSSDDAIAPASVGAYMAKAIPDSTSLTIACHGHAPHMSHAAETAAEVRQFVDGLPE